VEIHGVETYSRNGVMSDTSFVEWTGTGPRDSMVLFGATESHSRK
jgi:hypothetical protein